MTSASGNCTFARNRTSMRRTAVCLRNHTLKDRSYPPTFFYFKIIYFVTYGKILRLYKTFSFLFIYICNHLNHKLNITQI